MYGHWFLNMRIGLVFLVIDALLAFANEAALVGIIFLVCAGTALLLGALKSKQGWEQMNRGHRRSLVWLTVWASPWFQLQLLGAFLRGIFSTELRSSPTQNDLAHPPASLISYQNEQMKKWAQESKKRSDEFQQKWR